MNKYSSKAIKTAATVGMSLAMVLSAVPTVGNATPVFAAECDTTNLKAVSKLLDTAGITKDLMTTLTSEDEVKVETGGAAATYYQADEKVAYDVVPATGLTIVADDALTVGKYEIKLADAKKLALTVNFQGIKDALYLASKGSKVNDVADLQTTDVITYQATAGDIVEKTSATTGKTEYKNLFNLIKQGGEWATELGKVSSNCTGTVGEIAEYLISLEAEVATMFGKNYDGNQGFVNAVAERIVNKTAKDADLQALYDFKDDYFNNLTDSQKRFLNNTIYDAEEYLGYDSTTSGYQKQLSAYVDGLVEKFEDFVEDSKYTDRKSLNAITKSEIKTKIAEIKKSSEYSKFRNEDSVKEVIASYEDLYDEIKTVEEAIDKKNDAYVDYTKGGSTSVKNKYKDFDIDGKIDNMKTAHFEIYKAYKEAVVDAVYKMESKESVSRFIDKSTKSAFVTNDQLAIVLNDFDAKEELYSIYDDEDGTFGWDALEAHMNKVNDSLKTLENLSKYDAVTLSVNDKEVLVKMDDAVYFLQTDGVKNLTSAQTRTVRDAARKVTELMEAYRKQFGSIDSAVNGWVNKGNGDWAYYENGNAVTKWVASGSDWYYVKGGVMLRNSWIASDSQGTKWYYVDDAGKMVSNTTVNGYTFNSYGVWVK